MRSISVYVVGCEISDFLDHMVCHIFCVFNISTFGVNDHRFQCIFIYAINKM